MLDLTKENFEEEVLKARGYVLALASSKPENTTKARRLAISQKVLGLPVMAIYENGQMIDSVVKDDATAESIEAMILKYC